MRLHQERPWRMRGHLGRNSRWVQPCEWPQLMSQVAEGPPSWAQSTHSIMRNLHYCCLKLLSFKVVCYPVTENWNMKYPPSSLPVSPLTNSIIPDHLLQSFSELSLVEEKEHSFNHCSLPRMHFSGHYSELGTVCIWANMGKTRTEPLLHVTLRSAEGAEARK